MVKIVIICSVLFAGLVSAFEYDPYVYRNMVQYDAPLPLRRTFPVYEQKHKIPEPEFKEVRQSRTILPAVTSGLAVSKIGIIANIASFGLSLAKTCVAFVLTHGIALVLGSLAALGVCKLTPICTKLSSFESIVNLQRDLTDFATPERIASATEFVQSL